MVQNKIVVKKESTVIAEEAQEPTTNVARRKATYATPQLTHRRTYPGTQLPCEEVDVQAATPTSLTKAQKKNLKRSLKRTAQKAK